MKNWKFKDILLAVLTAVVGWLGGTEAYTYATAEEPTKYTETATVPDGKVWTVVAWFIAEKQAGGGATPAVKYTDNLGRYTVFVDTPKRPTDADIIAAFDKSLNPEAITVNVVRIIKPDGYQEPVPDNEPDIE